MSNNTKPKFLNRFTTLPFAIDLISRKKITLLNPNKWEDYNDRLTIERYKNLKGYNSIYALCLSDEGETIHHWNAFANGVSGCCIKFHYEKLIADLESANGVIYGKTDYIKLPDLKNINLNDEKLPFIKRHPFEPENEFRIIATSNNEQKDSFEIDINLDSIERITISNKLPKKTFNSVKDTLKNITVDYHGDIYRSTLFDNQLWAKYINEKTASDKGLNECTTNLNITRKHSRERYMPLKKGN